MKAKFSLVGILLMISTLSLSQDFDGVDFGNSRETILSVHSEADWETISIKPKEVDTLAYRGLFHNLETTISYVLIQNELAAGIYQFGEEDGSKEATFREIYPIFHKQYGEPDNLYEKKKFQQAIWHIGGPHPYYIELNGGHGLVKAHYDWLDRIEAYNKEAKKANKRK